MGYKIGVDVGGTFTDFLLMDDEGNSEIHKVPTTPSDLSVGVLNGLEEMAVARKVSLNDFLSQVDTIVHGTTITTNAILTRNYAKTGFITTKGFRDYLALRRGLKPRAYDSKEAPPEPIVPRRLRRTVGERVDCEGKEFIPLNEADVYFAIEIFKKEGVEAIAVCFLFSFANSSHEQGVKEILEKELPGVYVCLSSDVLPQVRVYERASTTVFNACVGPVLRRYIESLLRMLAQKGFMGVLLIMQSNGGMMSPEVAMDFAVNTLLSGPAGGPRAGVYYGDIHNIENIITIDMGGTSFDSCLVRNREPEITVENEVAMFRMAAPSIAIHTMGAGGGSIAYIDAGGLLRVGPQSAGAVPGPVCYGIGGGEPTVTDADLTLGYLNPEYFLGGKTKIYPDKARAAIEKKIAKSLGLDINRAAYGIYTLVNNNMAQGVKVASVDRGYDPRSCLLVTAGGAGPVHACEIAKMLEMSLILVPKASSVFCAAGMLISDIRQDFVSVCHILMTKEEVDTDLINSRYKEIKEKAFVVLQREGIPLEKMKFTYSCDLRYEAQFNEIEVVTPLSPEGTFTINELPLLQQAFDQKHDLLYGYSLPGSSLELICLRLVGKGIVEKPSFAETPFVGEDASTALKGKRKVYFDGISTTVPVYDGSKTGYGNRLSGPVIIEEPTTTIFLTPDYQLTCDKYRNYLIYPREKTLEESFSRVRSK